MPRFEPRFDDDCPACGPQRVECKGGGNSQCRKRDPYPSVLAGILDTYGGLRFVVSYEEDLCFHTRHDELLIVVPKLWVHSPIAWNDIPMVVGRIEHEVRKWIVQRGLPNDPVQAQCVRMYKLRELEHPHSKRSLDLGRIVQT